MTQDMFTAAAMHGIATNQAFPLADRLQAALQALDAYEKRIEELEEQLETLRLDAEEAREREPLA